MIHLTAPSRLHFGLLHLPSVTDAPEARRFGSVGLMIDRPGIDLTINPAAAWNVTGPLAERALLFAQIAMARCDAVANIKTPSHAWSITIHQAPPEHVGLGTGTQLGLAVAAALTRVLGCQLPAPTLARLVQRGLRSGIGVHGFDRGGFLIDGGKKADADLAPLLVHHPFPDEWRVVLTWPRPDQAGVVRGKHGEQERQAFATLAQQSFQDRTTDILCRLVLLGLLPALVEKDLPAFAAALYEFNRRVGEMFAPIQGGTYSPQAAEIGQWMRDLGVSGVGQSSWGPAVFAVVEADQAEALQRKIALQFPHQETIIAAGAQHGARISEE